MTLWCLKTIMRRWVPHKELGRENGYWYPFCGSYCRNYMLWWSGQTFDPSNQIQSIIDCCIHSCCPYLRVLSLWKVASLDDGGILDIVVDCHCWDKISRMLTRQWSWCQLIDDRELSPVLRWTCKKRSAVEGFLMGPTLMLK